MTLTVRDILRFDVFQQAEAEVVAGVAGLDRPVRWVHLSDVPDVANLLQGGELLLTTGIGLPNDNALHRRYIRELAEVGVAGLVIGVRRTSRQLPEALIREAEARHVPLIVFQQEVRYVEITEAVHSTIINRQYRMLERADTVARDFAHLALSGAGTGRIVNRLAENSAEPCNSRGSRPSGCGVCYPSGNCRYAPSRLGHAFTVQSRLGRHASSERGKRCHTVCMDADCGTRRGVVPSSRTGAGQHAR